MLQKLIVQRQDKTSKMPSMPADSLTAELSRLEQSMSQLSMLKKRVAREASILRSLGFESRKVRHGGIPAAHRETFQWVFKPSTEGGSNDLLDWLSNGQETFWVAGKPGSGKSTFMKFLADHPKTHSVLSKWSHPLPVVIASHYFWSPGTEMQKSQQGLLQSLLYDIFRHCPNLIEIICESRWALSSDSDNSPWTLSELWATLQALSLQTLVECKFCFFIDGLDEVRSENLDMVDFCGDLIAKLNAPNIKLCLSSRPWNVFEDALGQVARRKLYIHELTRPDILQFVRSRLCEHPRWSVLQGRTNRGEGLIKNITDRSQGVFLWVFIITRLLREGLTNDDSFSDLQNMVDSFPSDLEPFFKKILESVPTFYREKMAETLQIALDAKEPLDAAIYSFHDDDNVDTDCAMQMAEWNYDMEPMRMRREQITRRLNGRCRGLLEQNFLGQIEFLHRTVVDFLRNHEMTEYLRSESSETFNANLAILRAYVCWIKVSGIIEGDFSVKSFTSDVPSLYQSLLACGIQKALTYAASMEKEDTVKKEDLDAVIDKMDHVLSNLLSSFSPSLLNSADSGKIIEVWGLNNLNSLFREIVLDAPLLGYLSRKLPNNGVYFSDLDEPALLKALFPAFPCKGWPEQALQKLTCLLQNGHDPNRLMLGRLETVWQRLLFEILIPNSTPRIYITSKFLSALTIGIIPVFLEHGADPNVKLGIGSFSAFETLLSILKPVFSAIGQTKAVKTGYLMALELFIDHGATFDRWHDASKEWIDHRGPGYDTLHLVQRFFTELDETIKISASSDETNHLRDIAQRIFRLAQDAEFPLESIRSSIARLVPSSHTQLRKDQRTNKRYSNEEWNESMSYKRVQYSR